MEMAFIYKYIQICKSYVDQHYREIKEYKISGCVCL